MTRWCVAASLVLGLLGCNKQADTSVAPGGYMGDGYAAQAITEREYAGAREESFAVAEAPPPPPAPPADLTKFAPTEPAPTEPSASEPQAEPTELRQIIYTASLQLAVYERDEVIELAEAIPDRYGGWIESRQDYTITLRVPAVRLAEVMAELATLGLVLGKTLQASDVTAEYTDLESRIAVLEQLHAQLLVLLERAKTVEEALKVRQELERVRLELESAKTRMRQLSELIGFSTLTLYLVQRGADEALPTSNDPFPWVDELGVESTEFR